MLKIEINDTDHILGSKDAPVELLEYADYECPYCGQAYKVIKEIQKEMGDKLRFVFRNFPLQELHPFAVHAAIAAEAATAQDKFWEMHDMLFENQRRLEDEYLITYAREVGMDTNRFEEDFMKDEFFQKVKADFESGVNCGVEGTPAFFVNGKRYDGNWKSPEFKSYLKSLVK
ncbi:MAG: DsbA family protein [Candidatus Azobacteroides sp.]|nr:DsbA family protein [Candidatus Azobacteroides sp.]